MYKVFFCDSYSVHEEGKNFVPLEVYGVIIEIKCIYF